MLKVKKNWGYKLGAKARAGEKGYKYFRVTAYDAAKEGIIDFEEIEQALEYLQEKNQIQKREGINHELYFLNTKNK